MERELCSFFAVVGAVAVAVMVVAVHVAATTVCLRPSPPGMCVPSVRGRDVPSPPCCCRRRFFVRRGSASMMHAFLGRVEKQMRESTLWRRETEVQWEETRECLERMVMHKVQSSSGTERCCVCSPLVCRRRRSYSNWLPDAANSRRL